MVMDAYIKRSRVKISSFILKPIFFYLKTACFCPYSSDTFKRIVRGFDIWMTADHQTVCVLYLITRIIYFS